MPAQIFYCLSEWHTHVGFEPSDERFSGMSTKLGVAMWLLIQCRGLLPCLHRQQASPVDTALLMVRSVPGIPSESGLTCRCYP